MLGPCYNPILMSEQKESSIDKGCVIGISLVSVFFLVPIVAWWVPVAGKILEWIKRSAGF
jgi:hypothetical protein